MINPRRFHFKATQEGDYLQENTYPKPQVGYDQNTNLQDKILAVPHTNCKVDLTKPPLMTVNGHANALNAISRTSNPDDCKIQEPLPAQSEPCTPSPYHLVQCDETHENKVHSLQFNRSEVNVPKGILKKTKEAVPCPCEDMSVIGRQPPGMQDPLTKVPVPNELRPVQPGTAPCYLPQPEDELIANSGDPMGPIGPWATGRVDWGPLAGLTGTRPVVDKYSISRFSEGEWRKHNKDMLDMSQLEQHKSNLYAIT